MSNFYGVCFVLISLSSIADEKLLFATHTRAPLSTYLQEIAREALKPYSIEVEVLKMPGSRVIYQVNNGHMDGDLSRVANFKSITNHDTSNYLLVNEPVVLVEIVGITLAKKTLPQPLTWDTLNQNSVAFLRGSKTIRKHLLDKNRVAVVGNLQALQLVATNRVGSAVMFAPVAKHLLAKSPDFSEKLLIHQPAITSFHLYIYLNKKHSQLVPNLESSLRQLRENGYMRQTADKYQVTAPRELPKVVQ